MADSQVHDYPYPRRRLSTRNAYLPAWVFVAMSLGVLLGQLFPDLYADSERAEIGSLSVPISIALLVCMYAVVGNVRSRVLNDQPGFRKVLLASVFVNWVVGPLVMFALAWTLLPNRPQYQAGLILIGLARSVAMVALWNDLAGGRSKMATALVSVNATLQLFAISGLGYFYVEVLPRWLGGQRHVHVEFFDLALSAIGFLGVPMVLGNIVRHFGERRFGVDRYQRFVEKRITPLGLYGFLVAVVAVFFAQGERVLRSFDVMAAIGVAIVLYMLLMWLFAVGLGRVLGLAFRSTATLAFFAACSSFELAIAIAIGVFSEESRVSVVASLGPIVEVPVFAVLAYVALRYRSTLFGDHSLDAAAGDGAAQTSDAK